MSDLIGRTLGNYQLVELLGAGAMGQVFRAHQVSLRRDVAVKVLSAPDLTDHHRKRFVREAHIQTRLTHSNLVRVFDAGEEGDLSYLVLELIVGSTLRQLMQQKAPLPETQALGLLGQLAGALHHLHAEGIVHRDVKPENVMVTTDGVAKVTDFGLARDVEASALTAQGQMLGTVRYMAPEHFSGKQTGAPADVYALGVIFFEMLTGFPPYKEEMTAALIGQKMHKPFPRAADRGVAVSEKAEVLLQDLTRKDPAERITCEQVLVRSSQGGSPPSRFVEGEAEPPAAPRRRTGKAPSEPAPVPRKTRSTRGRSSTVRQVVIGVTSALVLLAIGLLLPSLVPVGGGELFTKLRLVLSHEGIRAVLEPGPSGGPARVLLRRGGGDWRPMDGPMAQGKAGYWMPALQDAGPLSESLDLRLVGGDGEVIEVPLPRMRPLRTFRDMARVVVDTGALSLPDWKARFLHPPAEACPEVKGRLAGETVVFEWMPPRQHGTLRLELIEGCGIIGSGGGAAAPIELILRPGLELSRRDVMKVSIARELEIKARTLKEGGKVQHMDRFYLRLLGQEESLAPAASLERLEKEWKRHLADPAVELDSRMLAHEWLQELVPLDLWCREWKLEPPFDLWGTLSVLVPMRQVPGPAVADVGPTLYGFFDFGGGEMVNRSMMRTFLQYTYVEQQFLEPREPRRPPVLSQALERAFFDRCHEVRFMPPGSTPQGSWGMGLFLWNLQGHYYLTVEIPRVRGSPIQLTLASPDDGSHCVSPDVSRLDRAYSSISWRNIPAVSRWIELEIPAGLVTGGAMPEARFCYQRIPALAKEEQRGCMILAARWFDPALRGEGK